ncbi:RNA polymerase sigma factor [Cellulosimicrobium sp. NPDC055967]|uniref:RNA polymerase sigma factor n=1 Tax=Cellulosimicrobium sp. NPDC055967 TaxID=3345670 RepID=UPI0035E09C48
MSPPPEAEARERLDRLYRDHARSVYRCAATRLSPQDAEDVVCEVFVVAWRRITEVPPYELGWLLRVTRNVMANHLRAGSRRAALARRVTGVLPASVPDHAGDVVGQDAAERLLAQLPVRDQEVLRLLVLEDLSVPELAEALGCRPNTASVRVRRAKERLARLYAELDRSAATPSRSPSRTPSRSVPRPSPAAPSYATATAATAGTTVDSPREGTTP